MRRTKIVCTIGPACESEAQLRELAQAGMNVARLNFSHGSHAWHRERAEMLRRIEEELDEPIALLQDVSGPKLRIGGLPSPGTTLLPGQSCVLTGGEYAARDEPR